MKKLTFCRAAWLACLLGTLPACNKSSSQNNTMPSNVGSNSTTGSSMTTATTGIASTTTGTASPTSTTGSSNPPSNTSGVPTPRFLGRVSSQGSVTSLVWGGTTILGSFSGSQISVALSNSPGTLNYFDVVLDGGNSQLLSVVETQSSYSFSTSPGNHTIKLVKRNEASYGTATFQGFSTSGSLLNVAAAAAHLIEFIGDSISNGYGVLGQPQGGTGQVTADCTATAANENTDIAYTVLSANLLNADYSVVAESGHGVVRNYDQSTTDLVPQLWLQQSPLDASTPYNFPVQPSLVVINLGTNDFTVMDPNANPVNPPSNFVAGYVAFLQAIRTHYPQAPIICYIGPMLSINNKFADGSAQLTVAQTQIQQAISTFNDAKVYLHQYPTQSTVADNLGCNYHPGPATHQAMAKDLAAYVTTLLGW